MKTLLLIDGNSLLHRAYHAYPILTTSGGETVGAVYGFTTILLSTIERLKPTHVLVAWDVGKKTFRHEVYEEYKAGRKEMDVELFNQIDRTKQVVEKLNIPQIGIEGYEGDDIIGTVSRLAGDDRDGKVIIVTGDRDALQLVEGEKVVVYMPTNGFSAYGSRTAKDKGVLVYDEKAVSLKYGLEPKQMIDFKALMGDASDNIKGVKGIGQVTATKLIQKFGTLDELYSLIDESGVAPRIKKLLIEGKESSKLSKELVTINRKVPLKFSWEACRLSDYDRDEVVKLFEELEFKSLVMKLPKDKWEEDLESVFV
jgi:DNA polymerase I